MISHAQAEGDTNDRASMCIVIKCTIPESSPEGSYSSPDRRVRCYPRDLRVLVPTFEPRCSADPDATSRRREPSGGFADSRDADPCPDHADGGPCASGCSTGSAGSESATDSPANTGATGECSSATRVAGNDARSERRGSRGDADPCAAITGCHRGRAGAEIPVVVDTPTSDPPTPAPAPTATPTPFVDPTPELRQLAFDYWAAFNDYDDDIVVAYLEDGYRQEREEQIRTDIGRIKFFRVTLGVEEQSPPAMIDPDLWEMYIKMKEPTGTRTIRMEFQLVGGTWKISYSEEVDD